MQINNQATPERLWIKLSRDLVQQRIIAPSTCHKSTSFNTRWVIMLFSTCGLYSSI